MSLSRSQRDPTAPVLPRDFISPCLLLLLADKPAYGYELLEDLAHWGLTKDPGSVYRALHELERDGQVRSVGERSASGPPRRRYLLEDRGRSELESWCERLVELQRILDEFVTNFWSTVGLGVIEFRGDPQIGAARPQIGDGEALTADHPAT